MNIVIGRFPATLRKTVLAGHCLLIVAFGALVAVFGWQVAELNSQSFSPALDLDVFGGREPWAQLSGDSG